MIPWPPSSVASMKGGRGLSRPRPSSLQLPPLPGMTGILLCAAGLPVCLTRAPKPILHPPPVSKSDVKPVPGVPGVCRKTKKKHLKKSRPPCDYPSTILVLLGPSRHLPLLAVDLPFIPSFLPLPYLLPSTCPYPSPPETCPHPHLCR